jgi:putative DNA base modification enzyme with NMAD domain
MAAFLANVGVNSAHAASSPLFEDGRFALLPIPERQPWRPPMLRLGDVAGLAPLAPATWLNRAVHLDPDLSAATPTYGDNCRRAGRAFSLRRAERGDLIVFLARLQPSSAAPQFHFVGCLEIDDALADVTADPGYGWWDGNAHVRRARASAKWDSFWVFKGGAGGSRMFPRSRRFARNEAEKVFGPNWLWRTSRTELQTIGSYTRAVRRVDGRGEEWLRTICQS